MSDEGGGKKGSLSLLMVTCARTKAVSIFNSVRYLPAKPVTRVWVLNGYLVLDPYPHPPNPHPCTHVGLQTHDVHYVGPNDDCVVHTLGEFFLFISCSYQPTDCAPTYLGSKSLVTTGTTARQPKPNGNCTNLLLPVKGGSEAVNWGQQGAEGHWEALEGDTCKVHTNVPLQTHHIIANPPYPC
jgi:hypothetical protein